MERKRKLLWFFIFSPGIEKYIIDLMEHAESDIQVAEDYF